MRILLVDDEESLLKLLGQFLKRAGIESIPAPSCAAALAVLRQEALSLDAAVIDLDLPDGSGEDIARAVMEFDPAVRVIIATGYPYDPPRDLAGSLTVLQKPFLPRALLNLLAGADLG